MASINRRGNYWRAQIRRRGYPSLSGTFNTKTEALAWARQHEIRMDTRTFVTAGPEHRATLGQLLRRYEEQVLPHSRHPAQTRGRINQWLVRPVVNIPLTKVGPSDFVAHRDARRAEGRAENTIRLELALISRVYNLARKEWGYRNLPNPIRDIEMPSGSSERERRLRPGEEEALLRELKRSSNPFASLAFALAIETSLRRGILFKVRWDWIDLEQRIVRIPATERQVRNKGVPRELPLSTRAVALLRQAPVSNSGRVLDCTANAVICVFKEARRKVVGSQDLHWHDLRHEATSRLFELGLNSMDVASCTGHRSMQMLKRYCHPRVEDLVRKIG